MSDLISFDLVMEFRGGLFVEGRDATLPLAFNYVKGSLGSFAESFTI